MELVADTDQFWTLSPVHSTAALVPARRGDWDTARMHVDVALAAARSHQEAMSIRYAGTAAATLAHSRGRPDEVLEAVAPVVESYAGAMPEQPGTLEWPALYAEALVRTGRREDARRVLDELEAKEVRTWLTAPVARVRGLVQAADGALEQALVTFERAAGLATDLGLPLDLALVRLERGSVLVPHGTAGRRPGRRAGGARRLRRAGCPSLRRPRCR